MLLSKKPRKSIKRPRRARDKRKSTGEKLLVYAFFSLVAFSLVFLWGLRHLQNQPTAKRPEGVVSQSKLSDDIESVDNALFKTFFILGASERDIVSQQESRKRKGELSWEFKDTSIELPNDSGRGRIEEVLEHTLSAPNVLWEVYEKGSNTVLDVETLNFPTHRVTFMPHKSLPKEKNISDGNPPPAAESRVAYIPRHIPRIPVMPRVDSKPKIVIIVDDLGADRASIDRLLNIPGQLTFAVLPNLPYSEYAAEEAHKMGRDVILHLPMEPKSSSGYSGADAGPYALLTGLSPQQILSKLEKNLSSVPHIKGVSNHMGSKFTERGDLMELVLERLRSKGLFFVDSRTTSNTQGYNTAKSLGIKAAERDLFLDESTRGEKYVRSQLEALVQISKKKGYAIGICHPYPETIEVLEDLVPKMKTQVELIPISRIVK